MSKATKKQPKAKTGRLSAAILDMIAALHPHSTDYCHLYTTFGTETIILNNFTMMSVIRVHGLKTVMPEEQYEQTLIALADDLTEGMRKTGHQLSFLFRRDNFSGSEIEEVAEQKRRTAKRLGFDLEALIDEDLLVYRDRVYHEEMYLAVFTNSGALDKTEKELERNQPKDEIPDVAYGQKPFNLSEALYQKHRTFYEHVLTSMAKPMYKLRAERCNVVNALRAIKRQLDPATSRYWTPKVIIDRNNLPDSEARLRAELKGYKLYDVEPYVANPNDASHMLPPPLADQLITHDLSEVKKAKAPAHAVRYGGMLYSCLTMQTAPSRPKVFSEFFDSLNQFAVDDGTGVERLMPYSVCFTLTSNAQPSFGLKYALGGFVQNIPPSRNKEIYLGLQAMKDLSEDDVAIVGLQISFMTWAEDTPHGEDLLRIQKMRLMNAIENWGGIGVTQNTGDNNLLWQSNHLISEKRAGEMVLLPLADALMLMPFSRSASVFPNASIFYASVDGKPMGKEIWSPLQPNQFHVITGGAGRGKSVLCNDIILEHVLQPNISDIPYILIVDKGASSKGLMNTLKESRSKETQHFVEYKDLLNHERTASNPFDIKVGLKTPLQDEVTRIRSFLMTLIEPLNTTSVSSMLSNVVAMLVEEAYKNAAQAPNMFNAGQDEELSKLLLDLDFFNFYAHLPADVPRPAPDWYSVPQISLYEMCERCHVLGERSEDETTREKYYRARDLAHRYAMPRLPDLMSLLTRPEFVSAFGQAFTSEQMPLLDYVRQSLSSACAEYPAFANFTTFDAQNSRILALDLNNVISIANPKQNSLFLQAALMIGLKKITLVDDDLPFFPEVFQEYYKEECKRLKNTSKVVFVDEFKNGSKDKNFMDAINTGGAEWRKFKVATYLASQHISDFKYKDAHTEINILRHSTQIFALETPKNDRSAAVSDLDLFKSQYNIDDEIVKHMDNMGRSPVYGSLFFTHIITSENQYNLFICRKVGNQRLWALNTSPIDKAIREATVAISKSYSEAIRALAFHFGPSATDDLQDRVDAIEQSKDNDNIKKQALKMLMENTAKDVVRSYQEYKAYRRAEEERLRKQAYEQEKVKQREEGAA